MEKYYRNNKVIENLEFHYGAGFVAIWSATVNGVVKSFDTFDFLSDLEAVIILAHI